MGARHQWRASPRKIRLKFCARIHE
jgi:hypothetical protein